MLPFSIQLRHGEPVYEQMLAAVRRALFTGELRDSDPFPSVRILSQELRISPTTAHKVVGLLKREGLLVARPGVGMVVTSEDLPDAAERRAMLRDTAWKLVREARDLSLGIEDVMNTVKEEWNRKPEDKSKER